MTTEKAKALELAIGQIERQFGRGAVMRLGDASKLEHAQSISTGSLALDMALGIGGIPRGRVTEVFGTEASGKSTLAYHIMAEAQRSGGTAAYVDAEHALDPIYSSRCGVDTEALLVSQPDTAEQGLEICEYLVRSSAVDVVVVDSVAALVPKSELEGDMGDTHVGLQARLMSQALRKLTGSINRSHTCVMFINQLRMKIGVVFGNPETTTGGRALGFYASVRLDIRRVARIKDGDEEIGNRTRVKVVKNKLAPPYRQAEFDMYFQGEQFGVSREADLLDLGVDRGLIDKSGTWFSYEGERLGQGRENARSFLVQNPRLAETIEARLREALGLVVPQAGGEQTEGEEK